MKAGCCLDCVRTLERNVTFAIIFRICWRTDLQLRTWLCLALVTLSFRESLLLFFSGTHSRSEKNYKHLCLAIVIVFLAEYLALAGLNLLAQLTDYVRVYFKLPSCLLRFAFCSRPNSLCFSRYI